MYGKCYVYKRATLINGEAPPQIIDYSDGTEPFNCEVHTGADGYLIYKWKLNEDIINIPLNVPRSKVDSIIRKGVIPLENGTEIQYEFIFGKYRNYLQFYSDQLIQLFPLLMIIAIIILIVSNMRV